MIVCPNCHHQNMTGAIFCNECGAKLLTTQNLITRSLGRLPTDSLDMSLNSDFSTVTYQQGTPAVEVGEMIVSLHLMEAGKMITLSGRTDFTIGRVSEGQPILPDIDLSPYDAYSQGVSRLHASMKVTNRQVMIIDLGSSNGTRLNGQKIVAHVEYPLGNSDMISLGKFKIQILINYQG